MNWTEERMQNALTERDNLFDYTRYAVVPNVSYALLDHGEADLVCLSKTNTFHEVEIKVSRADLRADAKKHLGHQNRLIAYTWFAVPAELEEDALELVPERFGIVVIEPRSSDRARTTLNERHSTRVVRKAKKFTMHGSRKPTDAEVIRFLRTGVIRMWTRRRKAAT